MNSEIFKKDGTLRVNPPKKYECTKCGTITSKPATLKTIGISFYVCNKCTGRIQERNEYIEWKKRRSGQWDVEQQILFVLSDNLPRGKEEIQTLVKSTSKQVFEDAFSQLCYCSKIKIHNSEGKLTYSL